MASQNLNVGTSANSNDGDTLRAAFIKLKQMFAEVYGQTYSEQGDLSGTNFKIKASQLQMTADAVAGDDGKVLTYDNASGSFTWEDAFTGTIGDITGIVAGDGLTGSSLSSDEATINVVAGTGITVAADSVSLASTVQDEITLNTAKTGITATQAADIIINNAKLTDQTVVLTGGTNVTVTGTYPSFTIASDDVVGAVTSVNTEVGAVVLDTADIAENTNLYYTEARVTANTNVAANTAKTGITTAQAGEIVANNAKLTNATHTGDVTGSGALTIADDVVTAAKLDVSNTGADGQILQYNTDGTMTWVTGVTGDITAVTAGDGLTGGGTGGDVTLNVVGGDGITAAADEISLSTTVAGDGLTLTTGVLSVDTIQTGDVADDAITSPKLAEFDDTFTAGTSGDIIVSNGTDFIHSTMSGDATIVSGGAITIADNAITAGKLADAVETAISDNTAKDGFPGFGTTAGTSLEGDTALLQLGTSGTTALAGDTALLQLGTSGTTALAGDTSLLQLGTSGTTALAGDTALLALGTSNSTALAGDTTTITTDQASKIAANDLKEANVTHSGDVTDASGVLTLVADKVITSTILNDNVTHDKLENRYTEKVPVATTTGPYTLDWSAGAVFVMSNSLTGAIEFDFTNYKVGQTIDIYNLTGAQAITFDSDATTSETFNKCGGVDYVGTSTNLIQVQCVDDSAAAVFNYAVSAYEASTTP